MKNVQHAVEQAQEKELSLKNVLFVVVKERLLKWHKLHLEMFQHKEHVQHVKELVRLLRYCSNNINQYAKKANESGDVYKADIEDIKRRQDRLWDMANEIMERLAAIL